MTPNVYDVAVDEWEAAIIWRGLMELVAREPDPYLRAAYRALANRIEVHRLAIDEAMSASGQEEVDRDDS